ncbi:MAG: hypothetical protein QM500_08725 [Methylococcales bacterium]
MKILLTIAVFFFAQTVLAHNEDGAVTGDKLYCSKMHKNIQNNKFPDGSDLHKYYEQCGLQGVPGLADQAIQQMEAILKAKMGDRYPGS